MAREFRRKASLSRRSSETEKKPGFSAGFLLPQPACWLTGLLWRISPTTQLGDTQMFSTVTAAKKIILALAILATATTATFANAPGGAYIQCDPHNPQSPIRCTPDGW